MMRAYRSYPPRPVSWGAIHEAPPPVIDRQVDARPADWLFLAILRPMWAYRLELALIALLWAVHHWLTARLGAYDAAQVILAAALVVGMLNWTRDPLARALYRSHARRRWALACRHADLASRNDRVPWVMRCVLTRAGEQLRVRLPAGGQVPDLENEAERIAAFLGVREVRVTKEPANARYARVVVIRRDPLAGPQPIPWPLVAAERLSLWRPIPVGVDEDGTEVCVSLPERNLLEGGEPGSGKSTIVQLLIAAAALDPSVRLTLFDPKLVELAVWQACGRLVGPNVEQAIEALKQLIAELDDRYLTLLANRARKVTEGDGLPLHLLVVEELGVLHQRPRPQGRPSVRGAAARLRGPRPRRRHGDSGDHPEALGRRGADLSAGPVRVSLGAALLYPDASDTILGRGWASQGYSAASIDPAARGVGWLLQEGGIPVRLRACYLDDLELADLTRRAELLRGTAKGARPTLRLLDGAG